jgi:hypothetical protein
MTPLPINEAPQRQASAGETMGSPPTGQPETAPPPWALPASLYAFHLSYDRLVPGVDNLRFDVHLSPALGVTTRKLVRFIMARLAQAEDVLNIKNTHVVVKERDGFKRICGEVLQECVHIAKSRDEIQIDYLGQVAVLKLIIETVRDQFTELVESFQRRILVAERAGRSDEIKETVRLKQRLSQIRENKSTLIRQAGLEMFGHVLEVHRDTLAPLRTANFGAEVLFPEDIFSNPLLHVPHPPGDEMMLEMYMLLGRRMEDPDQYQTFLKLIRELTPKALEMTGAPVVSEENLAGWLKHPGNMAALVDPGPTLKALKRMKKEGGTPADRRAADHRAREQKLCLKFFYRGFRRLGLMRRICAAYEMPSFYADYCPPLQPRQVLQFLTVRKSRRLLATRLKSYDKIYRKGLSLGPLKKKARTLRRLSGARQRAILAGFLSDFARYHRDLENFELLSEAMGRIHMTEDQKTLALSRANKTLFEFLLSHERAPEEKPIIRHVVIKADVRGATDVTHRMIERQLNPASFFSLNFFNPISDLLSTYGATKVFIEGDAVILAILEQEAVPSEWYAVSRACGLAIQILMIIEQYNDHSHRNQLPVLEVGCGICYREGAPAFLFDGDSRIMISPAINLADRMSGCTRSLRGQRGLKKGPFHLRVFQTVPPKEQEKTHDDLSLRYNVNGIELNVAGFKKLSREIKLDPLVYIRPGR